MQTRSSNKKTVCLSVRLSVTERKKDQNYMRTDTRSKTTPTSCKHLHTCLCIMLMFWQFLLILCWFSGMSSQRLANPMRSGGVEPGFSCWHAMRFCTCLLINLFTSVDTLPSSVIQTPENTNAARFCSLCSKFALRLKCLANIWQKNSDVSTVQPFMCNCVLSVGQNKRIIYYVIYLIYQSTARKSNKMLSYRRETALQGAL